MIGFAVIVMASSLAVPLVAQAQIPIPDAKAGDRVRVQSPAVLGAAFSGPLRDANQGFVSVTLGDHRDAAIVVPWTRITSLSLATGRDGRRTATKGALLGLAAALIAQPAFGDRRNTSPGSSTGSDVATIASFVVLPAAGAFVGWRASPPRWKPVDWRPSIDTVMAEGESIRLLLPLDAPVIVRSNRQNFRGQVLSIGDSLIVLSGSAPLRFAWSNVSELRVRGHRNRTRGAAIGFTSAGIASGFWLAVNPLPRTSSKGTFVVNRMLLGGAVGALIGTAGWSRVPIPIQ